MAIQIISTPLAPPPGGHYSQALVYGGQVFVSGLLPVHRDGEKCQGPIGEQTRLVLQNLQAILQAAGSDLDHVLKTTVYVSDINLWGEVNAVYREIFGDHRPARSVVPVKELHFGFLIEIDAVAAQKEK